MGTRRSVTLVATFFVLVGAVLALDMAGLSSASRASASVVSDWRNSDATAVAVGRDHTCAIETGVLYCWGGGTLGQLGYLAPRVGFRIPPPTDQSKAVKVSSVPIVGFTNTSVTAVSAGEYTTCAIENRSVYCWGANFQGQLGNGRIETQRDTAVKVSATNGFTNTNVTAISHHGLNGCALEGGVVYCWGANNKGSVGDGSLVNKTVPQRVVDNDGFVNNNVTAIAAGGTSCAVRGGELFCWGAGNRGQIGNGTTTDDNPRPRRVSSVVGGFQNSGVVSVSVTALDLCATRNEIVGGTTNRVMYCWGLGSSGNHGAGDTQSIVTQPRKVVPVAGGFTNTQVTSSHVGLASCAVNAGVVYCFGANFWGQVGDGTTDSRVRATRVLPSNGLLNAGAVTMVATRYDHTCAIENRVVYCWGVAANGRLGNGETTGTFSSAVSAASLPGAPVISGATAGTTAATVTVSAGPGGVPTSYTVTASASGQPTLTCTVMAPATSCDFQGLVPNTTYTFTATATSDQGTSPPSAPVQRTTGPLDPPLAPSLVPGNGQLQVTINPATTGGTPTGYIAYASPGGGSCTVLSPATSCTISPLTNGTTYTVTTSAFNDDGPSAASPSTSAVPGPPNPPLAPVLEVGNGSLTVTVSPAPTGGTASHYSVFVQPGGRTCTVTPPATSCVISGLPNGVTYSATTSATNQVGTSGSSPSTSALVDVLPVPLRPGVEVGATGVTVSAASLQPGSPTSSYVVYLEPGGHTCTVTSPNTNCYIDGLTVGGHYTVTTTATNLMGTSGASPQLDFEFSAPGESQVGVAGFPSTTSMTVTVSAGSPGGPPTTYVVVVMPGTHMCTVTAPDDRCDITGLTPGATYTVTASATNGLSTSTQSALFAASLTPPDAPPAPTVQVGNGSATVSVSPANTGGVPSWYTVYAQPGNHTCTVTVPATSCTLPGLINGTTYTVTTSASNVYGTSPSSPATTALVDAPPIALQPTVVVGSGGVTVSGSVDPAGGSVSSYTFTLEPGPLSCTAVVPDTSCFIPLPGSGTYTVTSSATNSAYTSAPSTPATFSYLAPAPPVPQTVTIGLGQVTVSVAPGTLAPSGPTVFITVYVGPRSCVVTPPATSCTITNLTGGQIYDVTAAATNGVGTTPSNAGLQAAMLPPDPPPAPLVLLDTSTSANVLVVPPLDGQVPTSYTVTATSSAGVTRTCTVIVPADECYLDNLTGGQSYSFSVVAHNAYGPSQPGQPTVALLQEPSAPLAPIVVPGNGRAQVTVVPGPGGGPATDYIVIVEPGPFNCDEPIRAPALTCTVSGLTNGVAYTFTVIASNGVGSSTPSPGTVATPQEPSAPLPPGIGGLIAQPVSPPATVPATPTPTSPPTTVPPAPSTTVPVPRPVPDPSTAVLPVLPLGTATVIVNGQSIPTQIELVSPTEVAVRSTGFELVLAAECASGCQVTITPDGRPVIQLEEGGGVRVSGIGFLPGSVAYVWLFSEPRLLGTVVVNADGTFVGTLPLGDLESGEHTLQVNGISATGAQRSANLGVLVGDADLSTPAPGRLPATGQDGSGMLVTLALLCLVTGGVVLVRRRRLDG